MNKSLTLLLALCFLYVFIPHTTCQKGDFLGPEIAQAPEELPVTDENMPADDANADFIVPDADPIEDFPAADGNGEFIVFETEPIEDVAADEEEVQEEQIEMGEPEP